MEAKMSSTKQQCMDCNPTLETIRTAEVLYDTYGKFLAQDPGICNLRKSLDERLAITKQLMLELGVIAACRFCEEEDGGSCCGTGIENKYGPVLLLANLLLEGTLPAKHNFPDSCYFLGNAGCILKVRHVLCVNYLCTKIRNMLAPEDLMKLQNAVGDELDAVFLLHEKIKRLIRSCSDGN